MDHIAFDLGGSGGKTFVGRFDGSTLYIENVHRFENEPVEMGGSLYWDIFKIYGELLCGIKAGLKASSRISTVGIDSFCNDFSLVDKNGEMLTPVRCYRDKRTTVYEKEIYAKMSKKELYMKNGNQIAPFNTLMQLAAMKEAGQGFLLDKAYKLLFVPDLLIYYLTGQFTCEYTLASVSQMYSYEKNCFDDAVLAAYGIKKDLFAPLHKSGSPAGRIKEELSGELGADLTVINVCEHDTASAFLGSVENDAVIISSGTWSVIGVESDAPLITEFGFAHNFANEGGYTGHHRILRNVMGSWLLQQLRSYYREHGEEYSHAEIMQAAEKSEPFKWLIDVDDTLFFSPGDMPEKIRSKCMEVYGTAPETLGELARCVCESLAMKYRWVTGQLEKLTGRKRNVINIIGGGCKNELLNRMTANAAGLPVVAGPADATAVGNIFVQMTATGEISSIKEGREYVRKSAPLKTYKPDDANVWAREYMKFKEMYKL